MNMILIKAFGAAILCAMCSVRFNGRGKDILIAGFIGSMAAFGMGLFDDVNVRALVSGLVYSVLSEVFGRILDKPVAVYYAPVLVPFVPGKLTFVMMGEFVNGDRIAAMDRLAEILCICGMIALAILLVETAFRIFGDMKKKSLRER